MFLISSCSCLCPIHWSQMLSWEWRCSWSSADRRCSNYIWVTNNFIAYLGATYNRGFMVILIFSQITIFYCPILCLYPQGTDDILQYGQQINMICVYVTDQHHWFGDEKYQVFYHDMSWKHLYFSSLICVIVFWFFEKIKTIYIPFHITFVIFIMFVVAGIEFWSFEMCVLQESITMDK